jgi:hypothetical protein
MVDEFGWAQGVISIIRVTGAAITDRHAKIVRAQRKGQPAPCGGIDP